MRTIEHARETDHLGRYYTQNEISQLLVGLLPSLSPSSLLDLGAGEGSLSVAALSRWTDIELVTVDVDRDASRVLSSRLKEGGFQGKHHHLPHDALGTGLKSLLSDRAIGPIGAAVCNPPFLVPKWRKEYGHILEDAGFSGSFPAITSTDAAALFLAQNLRLLNTGGELGIIVPDSLVCAEKYLGFRASLLQNYDVVQAIRLPRGSFTGTDALAHILVVSKKQPSCPSIRLSCLASAEGPMRTIHVERDLAIRKLDYSYHAAELASGSAGVRLRDVLTDLRRGSLNSAEVRASTSFVLHTTNIDANMRGSWLDFDKRSFRPGAVSDTATIAEAGDIVVGRVGRNAADKVIGVAKGRVALSDCLFRLRVQPEHREQSLRSIASESGKRWMEMRACGVAARHIAKNDLLNLPLDCP
jgi:type I restriction enzyme M protein